MLLWRGALIAGETWAHAATWNRFAPLVFNMAWRALGSEEEAEDITQEVFYRLFARVKTLCKPESLRSFIVSFAIRILKWEFRRRRAGRWLTFFTPNDLPEVRFAELILKPGRYCSVFTRSWTSLGRASVWFSRSATLSR